MKTISIVVPAYNEEDVIEIFYEETKKVLDNIKDKYNYEILFVDDGSCDKTLEILKSLNKKDHKVQAISFSRNFGKEAGIYAGLSNAKGELVVLMDADLQNDPKIIIEMIKYIEDGYDIVTTVRNRKHEKLIKSMFSRLFYKLMKGSESVDIKDNAQDFRMITRQVVNAILELKEYNRFSKDIFSWVGFKTKYIEVENRKRVARKDKMDV